MKKEINELIIASDGWPLEQFIGRPIANFIRRFLHGRKIVCGDCWYSKQAQKASGSGRLMTTQKTK